MGTFTGVHAYLPALIFSSVPIDRIANLDVTHDERAHGRSTYTLRRMIKLASFLLINHSYLPLRFMVGWGMVLSLASLMYAAGTVAYVLLGGHLVTGWPSLAVLISFLCGNILLFMGIVGEYVEDSSKNSRVRVNSPSSRRMTDSRIRQGNLSMC